MGDPVVAIAAVDEETAEDAARSIAVDYETFQPVMSINDALLPSDKPIHDYSENGNIHKSVSFDFGDTDDALLEADLLMEDLFFYQGSTHLPIEQHAAVARFHPDGK